MTKKLEIVRWREPENQFIKDNHGYLFKASPDAEGAIINFHTLNHGTLDTAVFYLKKDELIEMRDLLNNAIETITKMEEQQ